MITNSKKSDRQQRLRKVAILVATLDEPLAERLLADLPAREEDAVRKIIENLEAIEPGEYRAVMADFRQGIVTPVDHIAQPPRTQLEGVELDPSLLARMAKNDNSETMLAEKQDAGPWQTLSDADVATLVEMLSAEQPQTIAVVLSQLESSRSAELIARFSPTLQTEVLTRLADLDPADEQTLEVVTSQLAQWLTVQRQRHQRMAAGCNLVQQILQDTSDSQRSLLLARLRKRNPKLAEKLTAAPRTNSSIARQTPELSVSNSVRSTLSITTPVEKQAGASALSEDPLSKLESLDDQGLLRALQHADRQTVMLALAGASELLMKRIVKNLPRRKANQFRQQVRTIGPTRLSDMVAAQRELLRCGRESRENS